MRGAYFEGWYFKHQWGTHTLALIPAHHRDAAGRETASLQIITEAGAEWLEFPGEAFCMERRPLRVRVGANVFTPEGCRLDCVFQGRPLRGELRYGPPARLRGDIMGPFRFVPGMECRHSVLSMGHTVTGELTWGDELLPIQNGTGYAEGDRGTSFPSRYVWTQSAVPGGSLMLSAAEVPVMGCRFTGCVGFVWLDGKELRLATYRGARVLKMGRTGVIVRQGKWMLTAELLEARPQPLRAPVRGGMERIIRESASCRVRYRLREGNRIRLDLACDRAGFEADGM